MPSFEDSARSEASPEQVWKLLYDPGRFPDWWAGVATVQRAAASDPSYTMYPDGYPDFPMPQLLDTHRHDKRVVISCLVSDLRFEWRLEPLDGGHATAIKVLVDIPEAEAGRLDAQRDTISRSIRCLAELAARA